MGFLPEAEGIGLKNKRFLLAPAPRDGAKLGGEWCLMKDELNAVVDWWWWWWGHSQSEAAEHGAVVGLGMACTSGRQQ